jgi:hypothetical protein
MDSSPVAALAGAQTLIGFFPADCLKFNNRLPRTASIKMNDLSELFYQPFNNSKETQILPIHEPAGTRIADAWGYEPPTRVTR